MKTSAYIHTLCSTLYIYTQCTAAWVNLPYHPHAWSWYVITWIYIEGNLSSTTLYTTTFIGNLNMSKCHYTPRVHAPPSPSAWSWYIRTWDSEHLNIDGGQLSWPFYFMERLLLRASCWSSRLCKCASVPKNKYTNTQIQIHLSVSFHGKVVAHSKLLVKEPG